MNEIRTNEFNYSELDADTANYLKEKESNMRNVVNNASEKIGKELYEAQQKLSNNRNGVFEKWYTALGFKKQSVYNYINRYQYIVQNLDNKKQIETFQELPPSLQNEVSKKSAIPELNQAVFNGDIKTHKEYKEMERKLKEAEEAKAQAERQIEALKKSEQAAIQRMEELEDQEPKVIERVIEDETKINRLQHELRKHQEEIRKLQSEIDKDKQTVEDFNELKKQIESLKSEKDSVIREIESAGTIGKFIARVERSFEEDLAPIKYTRALRDAKDNKAVIKAVNNILEMVEDWVYEIRKEIPKNFDYVEVIDHE